MKHFRLTEEQLADIQKRTVERGAVVKTNKIALPSERTVPPPLKYRNKKTVTDGEKFDSKKEADRYQQLKLLESAKEIWGLERQVKFDIRVNGMLVCKYIADFVYLTSRGRVVEDTKGYRTSIYNLKKKLVKACLGIEILET